MEGHIETYSTIEQFYEENKNLVYAFLSDLVCDADTKDDLSSVVWVRVMERSEKFLSMQKRHAQNYLRVMTRHLVSDYFLEEDRKRNLQENVEVCLGRDEKENAVESELFEKDLLAYLSDACESLDETEKDLIRMKFAHRMTSREIGEALDLSESAVRVRQLRLLRRLEKKIRELRFLSEGVV